jgi:serine/threonine protein kinase
MANTTPIHAGHGNWESPQFDHHNYKTTFDWVAAGLKLKYLPTRKTTREALRAVRRTLLGRLGAEHAAWLFLDSDLDDAKAVWSGSRNVGAGGFGKTVLYTGHDQKRGDQIDSLVVKNIDQYSLEFNVWKYPGLHKEAAILSDVNKQDPSCRTNFLRRFTFNEVNRRQRLYLEFCPHGDINRIRSRYMLYDQWLPELWVWCIFEQLCEGLLVLQQPAHHTTVMAGHGETWAEDPPERETMYVIHCDLKPNNILACDGNGKYLAEVDIAIYPEAQLGDFGVAHYDFADNSDNPSSIRGGTTFYRPPVCVVPCHLRGNSATNQKHRKISNGALQAPEPGILHPTRLTCPWARNSTCGASAE